MEPIFTWLTGYHDPRTGCRQSVQEAANGSLRPFVRHPDGSLEFGRWYPAPHGIMTAPLSERAKPQ